MHCLQPFLNQKKLEKHNPVCMMVNRTQAVELSEEGSSIEFMNLLKNTLDVPFTIYADLELILVPLEIDPNNTSKTIKMHEHIPCSFGYKVVCKLNDKLSVPSP